VFTDVSAIAASAKPADYILALQDTDGDGKRQVVE